MSSTKKVCIIGCGVSGLSSALILQELGWKVHLITKNDPRTPDADPTFSSLFPAASIIPHSISTKRLQSLFTQSQLYFQRLYEKHFPGLDIHEHFELFTFPQTESGYANLMNRLELFSDFKDAFHPQHPKLTIESGWKYDCFFADWSLYYPALLKKVLQNSAELEIKHLNKHDLPELPFQYILNCSELGALQLFEDQNSLIYRGHLLQIKDAPKLLNPAGRIISYNFTPGLDVYKSEYGNPQDVYCYPRSDGWILGGSRQQGELDSSGNWTGEKNITPTKAIDDDDIEIPAQISDLNLEIIKHTFEVNPDQFPRRKAKLGYRYVRKKEGGLRLETEEYADKLFVHNYGHGGAGVTLSWGCALESARMLEEEVN